MSKLKKHIEDNIVDQEIVAMQERILHLEGKVDDLKQRNENWRQRYHNLEKKYERLQGTMVNPKELEHFKVENDRLRNQVNNLSRENRAEKKLRRIQKILNSDE